MYPLMNSRYCTRLLEIYLLEIVIFFDGLNLGCNNKKKNHQFNTLLYRGV